MTSVELETAAVTSTGTRIRAWTSQALSDVGYAAAVAVWSVAGFTVLISGVAVTASLLVLVIGVIAWIGFVHVVRWTTWVDRRLAGWQRHESVSTVYRRPAADGFVPSVKGLSTDPQTWRDLTWLAVTSVVGFAGGVVVLTAAGLVAAYVSLPLWFWAVTHPHTEYGLTAFGRFTVDTLGEAATMTALGLGLVPVVLVLARWFARSHAALAVRLLGRTPAPTRTDVGSSHA